MKYVVNSRECKAALKNRMHFVNNYLKKGKSQGSSAYARNLQYMCITVLFQLVSIAFLKHYKLLKKSASSAVREYENTKGKKHPWSAVLPYYKNLLLGVVDFDNLARDLVFQEHYGHILYIKIMMLIKKTKGLALASESVEKVTKKRKGVPSEYDQLSSLEQRIDTLEQDTNGGKARQQQTFSSIEFLEKEIAHLKALDEQKTKYLASLEDRLKLLEQSMSNKNAKDDLQMLKERIVERQSCENIEAVGLRTGGIVKKQIVLLEPACGVTDVGSKNLNFQGNVDVAALKSTRNLASDFTDTVNNRRGQLKRDSEENEDSDEFLEAGKDMDDKSVETYN